jgi:hypothetical protein
MRSAVTGAELRVTQDCVDVEGKRDPGCGQDETANPEYQERGAKLRRTMPHKQACNENDQGQHNRSTQPVDCVWVIEGELRESRSHTSLKIAEAACLGRFVKPSLQGYQRFFRERGLTPTQSAFLSPVAGGRFFRWGWTTPTTGIREKEH